MRQAVQPFICFTFAFLSAWASPSMAQGLPENDKAIGLPVAEASEKIVERAKRFRIRIQGEAFLKQGDEPVVFSYTSSAAKTGQDAREARDEARKAEKDAIKAGQEARKAARESRKDLVESGNELRSAGKELRSAGQALRDADEALLRAARTLRMQGLYLESASAYSKFISDKPDSSRLYEARFWHAKSLLSAQKWDQSAEAFTEFLKLHSDQRIYSQQAKEDRIYCWKMRMKQNPKATPGLKAALSDKDLEIRVLAALALAENKDASGRRALEGGLGDTKLSEQCGLALWRLGLRDQPKTGPPSSPMARMLVLRVKSQDDSFEMRVPATFIKSLEKMVPAEAMEDLARNGMNEILGQVASAPKGQVLFEYRGDKGKTTVVISVE